MYRREKLLALKERLARGSDKILSQKRNRLSVFQGRLGALAPLKVLERGYAMIQDEQGHVLVSAQSAKTGDNIRITLWDGGLSARVTGGETEHGGEKKD